MKRCVVVTPHQGHTWTSPEDHWHTCPGAADRPTALAAAERVAAWLADDARAIGHDLIASHVNSQLLRADLVALVAAVGWTASPDEAAAPVEHVEETLAVIMFDAVKSALLRAGWVDSMDGPDLHEVAWVFMQVLPEYGYEVDRAPEYRIPGRRNRRTTHGRAICGERRGCAVPA